MAWHGSLDLHYALTVLTALHAPTGASSAPDPSAEGVSAPPTSQRTVGRSRHSGPLRVLRSLYPEAATVCHQVIVHPPGGVVGGDVLEVTARLEPGAHALLTTPGATRFYRSNGETAQQRLQAHVAPGARLEWLPLETLVHDAARARNTLRFELAAGATSIGWDLLGLGLPAAQQAFAHGRFDQRIELVADGRPVWLERSRLDFDDPAQATRTARLLHSPLGWDGHTVLGTLWFASGSPLPAALRDPLLDAARAACAATLDPAGLPWGCTAPNAHAVVLRALAPRVEPLARQFAAVWSAWRMLAWGLAPCVPRVWRT